MKNPVSIGTLIIHIASDPKDDLGKVLRQLPFVQEQLLAQGKMSLEDLSDEQLDRLIGTVFDREWVVESDAVGFGGIIEVMKAGVNYPSGQDGVHRGHQGAAEVIKIKEDTSAGTEQPKASEEK